MPKRYDGGPSRKQVNYKKTPMKEREFVNNPPLNGFTLGQVLFVDIDYEVPSDGRKTRPVIFLVEHDRHTAIVRPLYSNPRDDRVAVIFNRKTNYAGRPMTVDRSKIVAKTHEIIPWDERDAI